MFSHTFFSFRLSIIDDPVAAAKEMYRTLAPGGTAVTAFSLQIPQGECAQETRMAVYGPDAHLALYEKSAFLPVQDLDEFARAI
ncbi:hypothetical protein F5B17DRAFT_431332 [Nemania serpens]|nr:hypothetical protein F5B17DRAFT_431332 [Nemania serpens]